eukprot:UN08143
MCSNGKLLRDWSCTEVGRVAFHTDDGYFLAQNNEAELESFGPYNNKRGTGVLLIHNDDMSISLR